jgi:membrane protein
MPWSRSKELVKGVYHSCIEHNQLNNAATLSFFFLLSLAPLLVFLVSLMALLPVPNLDRHIFEAVAEIVPAEAMTVVGRVLVSIFRTNPRLLSLGILGAIWAASAAFNAMIDALNRAYGADDARPMWKRQLVALGLTVIIGAMFLGEVVLLLLGSRMGIWLAVKLGISSALTESWPFLQWLVIPAISILAVEVLYFAAPHVKHNLLGQIPGATLAVMLWLASSFGLRLYFRSFSGFTAVYGTLGAFSALMLWVYFGSLSILVGAELNAQVRTLPHLSKVKL